MDATTLVGYIKGWHGIYDPDNEDSITNAEALMWINMARRRMSRGALLRFAEFEDYQDTVASTRAVALPTGWVSFESLYILTDDGYKTLKWYNAKRDFDKAYPDRTIEGEPEAAVQWGNSMIIGPVPDDVYRIYRSGFQLPTDLVLGGSDDMLNEMWEGILWESLVLSGEYYTVPEQKHGEWKSRAADETGNLRRLYRTAKTKPTRIVSHTPGTIIPEYQEE